MSWISCVCTYVVSVPTFPWIHVWMLLVPVSQCTRVVLCSFADPKAFFILLSARSCSSHLTSIDFFVASALFSIAVKYVKSKFSYWVFSSLYKQSMSFLASGGRVYHLPRRSKDSYTHKHTHTHNNDPESESFQYQPRDHPKCRKQQLGIEHPTFDLPEATSPTFHLSLNNHSTAFIFILGPNCSSHTTIAVDSTLVRGNETTRA